MTEYKISRRTFGQALGAVAASGALPAFAGAQPREATSMPSEAVGDADALCDLSATELVARMQRKELSARDVMAAHLARIARVNPRVNAIVTLVADRAMADAARADERIARGETAGVLHGLPIAHKDLVDTAGIRTTYGSLFYADHVPAKDALIVSRIRAAGAITCGKTNAPEFGAGSQTFNRVFGATRNPFDLTRTCGGSSGGAAAALACGMLPIADGSDTGGSLRNPAAFCSVVGFRASPGRVVSDSNVWSPLSVSGPMARSVADVALFLSAIVGGPSKSPLSLEDDGARYRTSLERDCKGLRIAWWQSLGGIPFEPEVRQVVDGNRRAFEDLGCRVEEAEPDFTGVDDAFKTLRYVANHAHYAPLVRQRPDWVKDTIKFEVSEAERLSGADVSRALDRQARMFDQCREFFERYDYFVLPVTQVVPFSVDVPYPTEIAGVTMPSYIDWMRSCWYVTVMASPAISVPAGFTSTGLPVGIQIVGRHRDDWGVLQVAHAFEQATRHGRRRPSVLNAQAG